MQIKSVEITEGQGTYLYHIKSFAFSLVGAEKKPFFTPSSRLYYIGGKEELLPCVLYVKERGKIKNHTYWYLLFAGESLSPWNRSAWQAYMYRGRRER
jgi:hypothetical protein